MEAKAGGRDGEGEVAASSRLRGTCNVAQLEAFWTTVVEEGLFMSSHERRAVGFTLFQVRTCDLGLGLGLGLGLDLHCRGAMGLWLHRLRLVHLHLPCITCTSCLSGQLARPPRPLPPGLRHMHSITPTPTHMYAPSPQILVPLSLPIPSSLRVLLPCPPPSPLPSPPFPPLPSGPAALPWPPPAPAAPPEPPPCLPPDPAPVPEPGVGADGVQPPVWALLGGQPGLKL